MAKKKTTPNWTAIEHEYRAGLIPLRRIAKIHGASESTIRSKALAEDWGGRDLSERIRRETQAELQRTSSKSETEAEIVGEQKDKCVALVRSHQKRLQQLADNHDTINARLMAILAGEEVNLPCLGSRESPSDVLAKLARINAQLIPLERQSNGVDAPQPATVANGETPVLDAMLAEFAKRRANMEATEMEDDADDGGRY
jgi:hypothetical protein